MLLWLLVKIIWIWNCVLVDWNVIRVKCLVSWLINFLVNGCY